MNQVKQWFLAIAVAPVVAVTAVAFKRNDFWHGYGVVALPMQWTSGRAARLFSAGTLRRRGRERRGSSSLESE